MTTPTPLQSVRLDELIQGVKRASVEPLARLTSAVLTAEHLGDVADDLIGYFVDQARRAGASWSDIGRSMGVTKQAAQKRFVSRTGEAGQQQSQDGFAQFTPEARNVVVTAQNEARAARSAEIGAAHLLLGLLADSDGPVAQTLAAGGTDLERVRSAITAVLPAPVEDAPELVPFDAESREVLMGAFEEATRDDVDHVDSKHILLALARRPAGNAVLEDAGLDVAEVQRRLDSAQ